MERYYKVDVVKFSCGCLENTDGLMYLDTCFDYEFKQAQEDRERGFVLLNSQCGKHCNPDYL